MDDNHFLKNKKILIFQQRGWGFRIGHFLAKKLQAEGCNLGALTFKRGYHDFVLKQKEVHYVLVENMDDLIADPEKYLGGDQFSLKQICAESGVDSIWPYVMSLRHHTRSYADKYYFGFKQNVSDGNIELLIKAVYKLVRKIFLDFKPDLIIAPNFVTLTHMMFEMYAQKRGVKMLGVTDSKVRGITLFTHSHWADTGRFHKRLDQLDRGVVDSPNRERAQTYISEFRQHFKTPDYTERLSRKPTFLKRVLREISPYYQIFRWYTGKRGNYIKSLGITIDYKPPRIILRDHYYKKYYLWFANRFKYFPIEKVKKYAYFPLQSQPEATIDVMAPFFSNQIETARLAAMSLPDDYTLVVKDHPFMADKRSPSYLQKLSRTVNVKLVDYRIPNEKLLNGADLIISPSSTSIAEAAFYYKPAIQLGNLGTTCRLPNVVRHTDMTTLSLAIKTMLVKDFHTQDYERKLENYVAAAFDAGFGFNYWGVWDAGEKDDMEKLWHTYKNELLYIFSHKDDL